MVETENQENKKTDIPIILYERFSSSENEKSTTDKCIVLDIDETLLHTQQNLDDLKSLNIYENISLLNLRRRTFRFALDDAVNFKGEGDRDIFWGTFRPGLKEFLIFCFSYFSVVAIWSAGTKEYVEEIVKIIFADIKQPKIVYTRNDAIKNKDGVYEKPLSKMFNDPLVKGLMNNKNTLILDDRPYSFEKVNPKNGVLCPAYSPEPNLEDFNGTDDNLKKFSDWLLKPEVKNSSDVTKLNKNNIFD